MKKRTFKKLLISTFAIALATIPFVCNSQIPQNLTTNQTISLTNDFVKADNYVIFGGLKNHFYHDTNSNTDGTNQFFLYDNNHQHIISGITWAIDVYGTNNVNLITINQSGLVTWNQNIPNGDYTFVVKATIQNTGEQVQSSMYFLTVNPAPSHIEISNKAQTLIESYAGASDRQHDFDVAFEPTNAGQDVVWTLQDYTSNLIYIDHNTGLLTWSENLQPGTYNFKVKVTSLYNSNISDLTSTMTLNILNVIPSQIVWVKTPNLDNPHYYGDGTNGSYQFQAQIQPVSFDQNIRYELVDEENDYEDFITINPNNGKLDWSDQTPVGHYFFKVKASSIDFPTIASITTDKIDLWIRPIDPAYIDFINVDRNPNAKDNFARYEAYIQPIGVANKEINYEIVGFNDPTVLELFRIDNLGNLTWNYDDLLIKTYTFKIQATSVANPNAQAVTNQIAVTKTATEWLPIVLIVSGSILAITIILTCLWIFVWKKYRKD